MQPQQVAVWSTLEALTPTYALVHDVDLVIVRWGSGDEVSVLYGRCLHRGALLADGSIKGRNLVCGVDNWDYRYDTGVSEYHHTEVLNKFTAWVDDDALWVDADEIAAWSTRSPQPYDRDAYQGAYQDPHATVDEPHVRFIQELAGYGLSRSGHHGPVAAMGVPRDELPMWDDIQLLTAQLARPPSSTTRLLAPGSSSVQQQPSLYTSIFLCSFPT